MSPPPRETLRIDLDAIDRVWYTEHPNHNGDDYNEQPDR